MGCAQDIDRQLDRFLKEHCPDPALIRSAITRTQLWTVTEYLPDEMICRRGDRVRACWLVLSGQIEIRADDQTVAFRGAGELVGEQGLLHFLAGKTGARTADIKACGPVRLLCIDASFQRSGEGGLDTDTGGCRELETGAGDPRAFRTPKFSVANGCFSTPYLHLRPKTWQ